MSEALATLSLLWAPHALLRIVDCSINYLYVYICLKNILEIAYVAVSCNSFFLIEAFGRSCRTISPLCVLALVRNNGFDNAVMSTYMVYGNTNTHFHSKSTPFHSISVCHNWFCHCHIVFESGQSLSKIARLYDIIRVAAFPQNPLPAPHRHHQNVNNYQ